MILHLLIGNTSLSRLPTTSDLLELGRALRLCKHAYLATARFGADVSEVRHPIEMLVCVGRPSRGEVQYLVERTDARPVREVMRESELDAYLDRGPEAAPNVRLIRLGTPRLIPRSFSLADAIESGVVLRPEDISHHDGPVVIVGTTGILAVGLRTDAAGQLTAFGAAGTTPECRSQRNSDQLLAALNAYKQDVVQLCKRAAAVVRSTEKALNRAPTYRLMVERLSRDLSTAVSRPLTVAFLGKFSSGKSSLINAIIEDHLLPVNDLPTTATIHRIRYGPRNCNFVTFKEPGDLASSVALLLRDCGVTIPQIPASDPVQFIMRLMGSVVNQPDLYRVPDEAARDIGLIYVDLVGFLANSTPHLGKTVEWSDDELESVLVGGGTSIMIAEVVTERPLQLLRSATLIDLPGVDSMSLRHTQIAEEAVRTADLVLYLFSAQHAFSQQDHTLIHGILGQRRPDSVLFCINKIDTADNPRLVLKEVQKQLEERFGVKGDVIPVAGRIGMCARARVRGDADTGFQFYRGIQRGNLTDLDMLELSNVPLLEEHIDSCAERSVGPSTRSKVQDHFQRFCDEVRLENRLQRAVWQQGVEEQQRRIGATLAIITRYEDQKVALKERLLESMRQAGERALSELEREFQRERDGLMMEYLAEYRSVAGFAGARAALGFLDQDVVSRFRSIFEARVTAHTAEITERLEADVEVIVREVVRFADELENASWGALFGKDWRKVADRGLRPDRVAESNTSNPPRLSYDTVGSRMLLAVDPTGWYGEAELERGVGRIAHAMDSVMRDVSQAMLRDYASDVENIMIVMVDERIDTARARVIGYRKQLRELQDNRESWIAAMQDCESVLDTTASALEALRWGACHE